MKLLITGASGFVGRNVILAAPPDWRIVALYRNEAEFPDFIRGLNRPNIAIARCDLMDRGQVQAVFDRHGHQWDRCLYLAARVDIPWSVRDPLGDLLSSAQSLLHVLEQIRTEGFVFFSSGAVYDGQVGEANPHVALEPTLPYAISKLTCERYVQFFAKRRRSVEGYLNIRFFGAYGPYESPHKIYTRLVRAFGVEGKDSYTLYGDGRNLIDAMYVDDAVDAIRRMLTGGYWNDTIDLAAGRPLALEALVREVGAILGRQDVEVRKEGVANEKNEFWGSTRAMQQHFGFVPRVDLADGIKRLERFVATTA